VAGQASTRRTRVGLLVALLLAAANMRTPLASVPPVIGQIEADLHLNATQAGLLTTLPIAFMGLFAPVAHRLAARWGREAVVTLALVVLAVGMGIRLAGQVLPAALLAGVVLAGIGLALIATVLPGVVKEHFADRPGAVSGAYLAMMMGGAALAAAASVPLSRALGGWPAGLASWSLLAVAALVAWLAATGGRSRRPAAVVATPLPWRSGTAWLVTGFVTGNSVLFFGLLAWVSPALVDHGWTAARAGVALAAFTLTQLVAALALPAVGDRLRDRRGLFGLTLAAAAAGIVLLAVAPMAAPWLAVCLAGFGLGGGFSLCLLLLVDYAPTPATSAGASAMVFLVSYVTAAATPTVLGALRQATGSFTVAFSALLVVVAAQAVIAARLGPGRQVPDPPGAAAPSTRAAGSDGPASASGPDPATAGRRAGR